MTKLNLLDKIIVEIEYAIDTIHDKAVSEQSNKFIKNKDDLTLEDKSKSERLMRVNHMGEVCAQGLYRGQAYLSKDEKNKIQLYKMCQEEREHLKICRTRLDELKGRGSLLNGVWYASSFLLGAVAGISGEKYGAGFIEETEKQVSKHLDDSMEMLPKNDFRSRDILKYIKDDEEKHEKTARQMGSKELPDNYKKVMADLSNIMKDISYYL